MYSTNEQLEWRKTVSIKRKLQPYLRVHVYDFKRSKRYKTLSVVDCFTALNQGKVSADQNVVNLMHCHLNRGCFYWIVMSRKQIILEWKGIQL